MKATQELAQHVGVKPACDALSVARDTFYRRMRPSTGHQRLREAWAAHPERFVSGQPKPKPLPETVWINPSILSLTTQDIAL